MRRAAYAIPGAPRTKFLKQTCSLHPHPTGPETMYVTPVLYTAACARRPIVDGIPQDEINTTTRATQGRR